jgi:hypothetical protein
MQDEALCEEMVTHRDDDVRAVMAKSPYTPEKYLVRLAKDRSAYVACCAIKNKSATTAVFDALIFESGHSRSFSWFECIVSKHPKASADVLRWLAENAAYQTRKRVALRIDTPVDVLELLLADSVPCVRKSAQSTLDYLKEIQQTGEQNAR